MRGRGCVGVLSPFYEKVTSAAKSLRQAVKHTQCRARGTCCRFSAEAAPRRRTPRTWTRSPPRPTCRTRPRCPSRWRRRWRGTPIARGAWRGNRRGGFWRRAPPTGPRVCGRPRVPPAARGSPSPSSRVCTTEPCDPSRGPLAVRPRGARPTRNLTVSSTSHHRHLPLEREKTLRGFQRRETRDAEKKRVLAPEAAN